MSKNQKIYIMFTVAMVMALLLGACGGGTAEKEEVVIYTAKENEEIEEYLPVAEAALPDLQLEVLRLSTGDLTARLLAEKDNPQADVIWGVAATSMMIFDEEGMLAHIHPKDRTRSCINSRTPLIRQHGLVLTPM